MTEDMEIEDRRQDSIGERHRKRIRFDVEIYGDTVCPWCYIGKKSIDSAIEAYSAKYPEDVFDVVWKPFILWPNIKRSAYDKKAPILKMFGPTRAPGVFDRLASTGAKHRIKFNWDGVLGNSIDANKLVMLAYEKDLKLRESHQDPPSAPPQHHPPSPGSTITHHYTGLNPMDIDPTDSSTTTTTPSPPSLSPSPPTIPPTAPLPILSPTQNTLLNALFHATFTLPFDPSHRPSLLSLALSLTPPLAASASELTAWLDSDESTAKLAAAMAARSGGVDGNSSGGGNGGTVSSDSEITGVPSVLVQGRYRVGGSQKPEVYLGVFERVREGAERDWGRDGDGGVVGEEEQDVLGGGGRGGG